jgi:hypothetical protein
VSSRGDSRTDVRNTGLLSFGEAEEEDATAVTVKKKDMGRRDRE